MKRYDDFEKLCEDNNINFKHANNELNDFLGCEGSDVVENEIIEPTCLFEVMNENNKIVRIGVTSMEIEECDIIYYFWI